MEDILKRLLDAELEAQRLVDEANAARDRVIHDALDDAKLAEERFTKRIPEIQLSFEEKARERAEQTVGELQRRFHERSGQLARLGETRRDEAIEAAMDILLDPDRV